MHFFMKIQILPAMLSLGTVIAFSADAAVSNQPNMQSALASLQSSRSYLEKATPDKGGHRIRALSLTNQAVNEVILGIRYANK